MIAINQDSLGKGGNRIGYSDCPNVGLAHTKHDLIIYQVHIYKKAAKMWLCKKPNASC